MCCSLASTKLWSTPVKPGQLDSNSNYVELDDVEKLQEFLERSQHELTEVTEELRQVRAWVISHMALSLFDNTMDLLLGTRGGTSWDVVCHALHIVSVRCMPFVCCYVCSLQLQQESIKTQRPLVLSLPTMYVAYSCNLSRVDICALSSSLLFVTAPPLAVT